MRRLLACLTVATVALAGCGDDDEAASTTPTDASGDQGAEVLFPVNCTSGLRAEPSSVVVTCADSGIAVSDIQWQAWGAQTATGNGTGQVNDCDPDCVAGEIKSYNDAQLTLSEIKSCGSQQQYTRLELSFEGDVPPGSAKTLRQRFPCA